MQEKKLHWFGDARYDDIEPFNAKHPAKKAAS
jgi:hypothetical protein